MLDPVVEIEIAALAARYGPPRRVAVDLNYEPFSPLTLEDRYGEVCMIVRRTNGRLLTAKKTFYPPGAFRLLTGGVSHGESIAGALLREVAEETGLDVVVRRFLTVIEYRTPFLHPRVFATFAFLLDEVGGTLGTQDAGEQIESFREIEIVELAELAATLDSMPDTFSADIEGSWHDWGRLRAIVHRVAYELLQEPRTKNQEPKTGGAG